MSWTRGLLIATVVLSAFGEALIDRALVATPAWEALGPHAWADYSRHADLGAGLILYPLYGIGLLLLASATAARYRLDPHAPRAAGLPVYLTVGLAGAVIATTIKAAPIMLDLPGLGDDPAALRHAFEQFTLWGVEIRGVFGVLAFLTSLWALVCYPRTAG